MTEPPDLSQIVARLETQYADLQHQVARQRAARWITAGALILLGGGALAGWRLWPAHRPGQASGARVPGAGEASSGEVPPGPEAPAAAPGSATDLGARVSELSDRMGALEVELERSRTARASQTEMIARLRSELEQRDRALKDLIAHLEAATAAKPPESAEAKPTATVPSEPRDALVDAINGLLLEHGVLDYRLLDHGDVEQGQIKDTRWSACNSRGTAIGVVFARRATLAEDNAQNGVVITLAEGWITRGADKEPFSDGELKIAIPNARPAARELAAIAELLHPAATRQPVRMLPLDKLEQQLSELLEKQGYYLRRLEGVQGSDLKNIVVEEGVPGATPKRTITAATCRVQVVDSGSYIELAFEEGSITTRGREMKFWGNRYRLPLPHATPAEWQDALPGVVVKRDQSGT